MLEIYEAYDELFNQILYNKEMNNLKKDSDAYHRVRATYPIVLSLMMKMEKIFLKYSLLKLTVLQQLNHIQDLKHVNIMVKIFTNAIIVKHFLIGKRIYGNVKTVVMKASPA